jgi:hypothetical protein
VASDASEEHIQAHASYIAHWLKILNNDNRAIFTAASHAQRAADCLNGLQPGQIANAEAGPTGQDAAAYSRGVASRPVLERAAGDGPAGPLIASASDPTASPA